MSRPKKIIMLVDSDAMRLSVMRYLLSTHGYRVASTISAQEAITLFVSIQVDLVIADYTMPGLSGAKLIDKLKKIAPHIPMMLVLNSVDRPDVHFADAMVIGHYCEPRELLERIRIMIVRKRGPRKGFQRIKPTAERILAKPVDIAQKVVDF